MPTVGSAPEGENPPACRRAAEPEISWQLEEAEETALIGSPPVVTASRKRGKSPTPRRPRNLPGGPRHRPSEIPLSPVAPTPAEADDLESPVTSEWREVDEPTAPHATYSPAATQRFAVPAVTHEIPEPSPRDGPRPRSARSDPAAPAAHRQHDRLRAAGCGP